MNDRTTRRRVLQQLTTGASLSAALPILGQNPPPPEPVQNETPPRRYRFFSQQEIDTLDALGETIIPRDDHSPGAKAARVSQYIDALVSDAPARLQAVWRDGLQAFNRAAHRRFELPYTACTAGQQIDIMTDFAANENPLAALEADFFTLLKRSVIDGYYTSKTGIFEELEYKGNQALASFPGCSQ